MPACVVMDDNSNVVAFAPQTVDPDPAAVIAVREYNGNTKADGALQHLALTMGEGRENSVSAAPCVVVLRLGFLSESTLRLIAKLPDHRGKYRLILVLAEGDAESCAAGIAAGAHDVLMASMVDSLFALHVQLQIRTLEDELEQAAKIISLTEQLEASDELVMRDPLTGIANRRAFNRAIDREWTRHVRYARPLSVLFCDVDNFKYYNDHYGHQAGDTALRKIALSLHKCLQRGADFVGRYGGDEFTAVLGETSFAGAINVAERMRAAVEDLAIERTSTDPFPLTVSVGLAVSDQSDGDDAQNLLRRADRALYSAKEAGRNLVAINAIDGPVAEAIAAAI